MAKTELITTLHKGANTDIDVFPNIKKENIPNASIDESKVDPALLQKITPVVANPTIVGSEADLTSIQVGDTKYKVTGGGSGTIMVKDYSPNEWVTKTWTGLNSIYGSFIWTDGDNIYFSRGSNQYILNKDTLTWSAKTWTGLNNFDGVNVWTDGENVYYSNSDLMQYVLDKSTSTWSRKTWTRVPKFLSGQDVWTDGGNIYCSRDSGQFVLDKSTSTWTQKTWTGLTSFDGYNVWTDGDNVYLSYESNQYVLDKSTSTWTQKTWMGLTELYGQYIWTDGENIYYSYTTDQYVLDKATSVWNTKSWAGLTEFYGEDIWTDGENIYYSKTNTQFVLSPLSAHHPATILEKVAETGDYNDLRNIPQEMNITSQEIDEYFKVCDVAASVTTEGDDVVLNLTNADIVTENGEPVLTTEVPNVSVQNNILEIE